MISSTSNMGNKSSYYSVQLGTTMLKFPIVKYYAILFFQPGKMRKTQNLTQYPNGGGGFISKSINPLCYILRNTNSWFTLKNKRQDIKILMLRKCTLLNSFGWWVTGGGGVKSNFIVNFGPNWNIVISLRPIWTIGMWLIILLLICFHMSTLVTIMHVIPFKFCL